ASSGGKSGSIALTVDAIASVSVSPASTSVGVGATTTFTAAPKDSNNVTVPNAGAASWDTGNHAIATINSSGVANGVSAGGPITVTGTVHGTSGTAQLTVAASGLSLAITNEISWCHVTASVGGTSLASFDGSSASISQPQPAGTTITLSATPHSCCI